MASRQKINTDIETVVLSNSRRRCCICYGLKSEVAIKVGQIAHLDKNRNNNKEDNLAFLCFEHHNEYDSTTSQSKNLTLKEVKQFRKELYSYIIKNIALEEEAQSNPLDRKLNSTREFIIELDKDFNCTQPDVVIADIFSEIADFRKSSEEYLLRFNIEFISNIFSEFEQLRAAASLSVPEIEHKLKLRMLLDTYFFRAGGNVYDYFTKFVDLMIDYAFNKYGYISNFTDLTTSMKEGFPLFNHHQAARIREGKGFDVFNTKMKRNFKIDIPESEVANLRSIFGAKDDMFLTRFAGLDLYDLSEPTRVRKVYPKQAYAFIISFFNNTITELEKDDYFKIGNWQMGIA